MIEIDGGELLKDIYLIKGIKEKNQKSLSILMDKYLNYVFTIVNNIAKGFLEAEDVEEICIDVFTSLWNNADKIDSSYRDLKPYIAAIARNTSRNRLKSAGEMELALDDEIIIIDNNKVEEKVLHRELSRLLNKCISNLDEPDREIMIRYYFYYEKVKDIAKELDINENTVKTKLFRSRAKLKDMIEEGRFYNETKNERSI